MTWLTCFFGVEFVLHTALCKRIRDCTIYDRNHIVGWVLCFPLQKLLTIAHRKGVLRNVCSQKTKKTGDIPLHIAVFQGDKSAVEELLLPGPSRRNTVDVKDHICAQNNHAKTPAHIAAEGNHHE